MVAMLQWDRSHDWVLIRHFHERAELTVLFQSDQPSIMELIALRKCLPQFRDLAPAVLRERIGRTGRLEIGEFDGIEARWLLDKLKNTGLTTVVRNTSFVSYLPFDRTDNVVMIVEDNEEAKELAERMIKAGVFVQNIEG